MYICEAISPASIILEGSRTPETTEQYSKIINTLNEMRRISLESHSDSLGKRKKIKEEIRKARTLNRARANRHEEFCPPCSACIHVIGRGTGHGQVPQDRGGDGQIAADRRHPTSFTDRQHFADAGDIPRIRTSPREGFCCINVG